MVARREFYRAISATVHNPAQSSGPPGLRATYCSVAPFPVATPRRFFRQAPVTTQPPQQRARPKSVACVPTLRIVEDCRRVASKSACHRSPPLDPCCQPPALSRRRFACCSKGRAFQARVRHAESVATAFERWAAVRDNRRIRLRPCDQNPRPLRATSGCEIHLSLFSAHRRIPSRHAESNARIASV
jgi:hypothetical protein